jgi:trans-4-hydroxy-L-proline dehydratase
MITVIKTENRQGGNNNMKMTDRVIRLREQSLNATETLTAERAQLITRFYASREAQGLSAPMLRARAFEYLLRNKAICINDGELIVGERGPAPKATPTYPEISLHSIQDLEILDSREKVFFRVSDEVKKIYTEEIIPFWKGRSNRDRIMERMTPEWLAAYKAGIFTEFQEQRAPGHTVLGYKMFHTGFLDLKKEIASAVEALDFRNDPQAYERNEELRAMDIACDAIIMYAGRHAEKLEALAAEEKDAKRKDRADKDGGRLPSRASPCSGDVPRDAAALLVHTPRCGNRTQSLGFIQPWPPRPAPVACIQKGS